MMNKWKLLPRVALKGVGQNGKVYYPYMMAGIFSVFTFFTFSSIIYNEGLIKDLPKAAYAWMMLLIGRGLLGIIFVPFLYYANSFLIKRRTREFGLYSILGLEKRHIGIMLFFETLLLYLIVVCGGILLGSVLSKLFFLLLLKVSGLPINVRFVFTWQAVKDTAFLFLVIFFINLVYALFQVGRSKPVELFSGSKKGEKEPKWIAAYGILGVVLLALGYKISILSEVNSMIFVDFFFAVFLVIVGTYFLFTSGSVMLLRILKKKKEFYYKPQNFVTVSGMLYRMKKNAASLSNICIFSTMVIITLICTLTLYHGLDGIGLYSYPYDVWAEYGEGDITHETADAKVRELEEKYGRQAARSDLFDYMKFSCLKNGNQFEQKQQDSKFEDTFTLYFLTLEDYNSLENDNKTLEGNQILLLSEGADVGFKSIGFMGLELPVAEELSHMYPFPKSGKDNFGTDFIIVVKDDAARDACTEAFARKNGITDVEAFLDSGYQRLGIVLEGEDADKQDFVNELSVWMQGQEGYTGVGNGLEERANNKAMYGGLLFIGILFGMIFFMCLLLIMYYKQISEGYEDQNNFAIMQKVGMSDKEIKGTIHRQILLVFLLPLAGALMHTCAGMFMVENLMAALGLFDGQLMILWTALVSLMFVFIYGISYLTTAKTYYK
ncbi:MAG: ABC transporter permease, partial [Lachnospiraceae bacterium]|nr:ABC transporter permease [Lachnospiraceae bacterium]